MAAPRKLLSFEDEDMRVAPRVTLRLQKRRASPVMKQRLDKENDESLSPTRPSHVIRMDSPFKITKLVGSPFNSGCKLDSPTGSPMIRRNAFNESPSICRNLMHAFNEVSIDSPFKMQSPNKIQSPEKHLSPSKICIRTGGKSASPNKKRMMVNNQIISPARRGLML